MSFIPEAGPEYQLLKRAFQEELDRVGVPITSSAGGTVMGIASAIRFQATLNQAGQIDQSSVTVTMLAQDFLIFEPVKLNHSSFFINSGSPAGPQEFTILRVDRDPQDPTVTVYALGVI
jgi:hypothetical protein